MRIGRGLKNGDRTSVEVWAKGSVGAGPGTQEFKFGIVELVGGSRCEAMLLIIIVVDFHTSLAKGGNGLTEYVEMCVRVPCCAPKRHKKNGAEAARILFQRRGAERTVGQVLRGRLDTTTMNGKFTIHALQVRRAKTEKMSRLWG